MVRLSRPPHLKLTRKRRSLRVLITGGPTKAYLDRVRFISNYSTGAMAHEICKTFHNRRVKVAAVIGPTALDFASLKLATLKKVETFEEMRREVHHLCRTFRPDVVVFSAAVLDFVPEKIVSGKVSSKQKKWVIHLKPAPKIIDEIGIKFPHVRRIGFKLQWELPKDARRFGQKILKEKNLDALVLNDLSKVKGKSHPALLFQSGKPTQKASNKQEIAYWIADVSRGLIVD